MTRVVATLERDGYIARERWEEDRRVIKVHLTDKGLAAIQELSAEVRDYYQHIIRAIPQGQVDEVVNSVNTLLKAFEEVKPFCC
jgi:DNA-binding MarR family transcriptional regulator